MLFHLLLFLRELKAYSGRKHETAWVIQFCSYFYGRSPIGNTWEVMVIEFLLSRFPVLYICFLPEAYEIGISIPILQLKKLRYKDTAFPEVT